MFIFIIILIVSIVSNTNTMEQITFTIEEPTQSTIQTVKPKSKVPALAIPKSMQTQSLNTVSTSPKTQHSTPSQSSTNTSPRISPKEQQSTPQSPKKSPRTSPKKHSSSLPITIISQTPSQLPSTSPRSNSPTKISPQTILFPKTNSKVFKKKSSISDDETTNNKIHDAVQKHETAEAIKLLFPNVNNRYKDDRTLLMIATRNENEILVAKLLERRDLEVNALDKWRNTALHHAALNNNTNILYLLLHDPRVTAFVQNEGNVFAHELLTCNDAHDPIVRQHMFARASLDSAVNDEVKYLQAQLDLVIISHLTREIITTSIHKIKRRCENVEKRQRKDGRTLPAEACFPSYAKDSFIRKMITSRIKYPVPVIIDWLPETTMQKNNGVVVNHDPI